MAQVTIYVPDAIAARLRTSARRAKKSVSSYVVDLLARRDRRNPWPPGFADLYGICADELPDVEDGPADEVPAL